MDSKFRITLIALNILIFAPVEALGAEGTSVGNITSIRGTVRLDGKPATNGSAILSTSVIITGESGGCTLLLGEDTVVHMSGSSNLSVASYLKTGEKKEEVSLDLKYGKLRALVPKKKDQERKFNVKTRTAVMGVRGTHIYIDAPRDPRIPPTFVTIEGVAEVRQLPPPGTPEPKLEGTKDTAKASEGSDSGPKSAEPPGPGGKPPGPPPPKGSEMANKEGTPEKAGPEGEGPKPPPGVGPAPGGPRPPPPVLLAANQAFREGGRAFRVDPGQVTTLANAVAPPPPPIHNSTELNDAANNRLPPPPPPPGGNMGGLLPPLGPPPPPTIPFDPIADSLKIAPILIDFIP